MLPTNVQVKYLRQDKNQKGIYEIRIYLGRHNGKSKRKTKNIRATSKRAAIKIAETMIRDGELSITAPGRISHEITFQKFIEIWKTVILFGSPPHADCISGDYRHLPDGHVWAPQTRLHHNQRCTLLPPKSL